MARKKIDCEKYGKELLNRMFADGKGKSKHAAKKANNGKVPSLMIFAQSTLLLYIAIWHYYCDYLHKNKKRYRNFYEMSYYVKDYITYLIACDYSVWTIKTRLSALRKVFFFVNICVSTPPRRRQDIKRSRQHVNAQYLRRMAAKYRDLVLFCLCVGPRAEKELRHIRGTDLKYLNGQCKIHIHRGKGGRKRNVTITGTAGEIEVVTERCVTAGDNFLFAQTPGDIDIHAMRAAFACRVYLEHERDLSTLSRREKYYCRGDMAGVVLDREAMMYASRALGHNRLSVIAEHYIWPLQTVRDMDFVSVLGV